MPYVIDSRPPVALPSAASSITLGREQHYLRPRIDNSLQSNENVINENRKHCREVNDILAKERSAVQERYKGV